MDFSSAFNTIQPHLLLKRLLDLHVEPTLVLWIRSFLTDRPQHVNIRGHVSDEIVLNTGAPQGCVLSPILFSLYTNELTCNGPILSLIKFADDMALVARLKDEHSLSQYIQYTQILQGWFESSFLYLNVDKTKELCLTGAGAVGTSLGGPVRIRNQDVEIVTSFKYLGTILDKDLSFTENVDFVYKKTQQRLYLLRKLKSFGIKTSILESVYRSLIESVLTFNIVTWHGNLSVKNRAKLARIVNLASKVIGSKQRQLPELYYQAVKRKAVKIVSDNTHPLHESYEPLPSGRRFRVPLAKKNQYRLSFIPTSIRILNSQ